MDLMLKIDSNNPKLEDIAVRIFQGLKTGADSVFILNKIGDNTYFSQQLNSNIELEKGLKITINF